MDTPESPRTAQSRVGKPSKWLHHPFATDLFSEDNVKVGDLVVKDQEFIEATKEPSVTFLVARFDGILGLGFKEISVGKSTPVWEKMVAQGLVKELVFSFWHNRNSEEGEGGELVFGGVDPSHFIGEHTYVPVTKKGLTWVMYSLMEKKVASAEVDVQQLQTPELHYLLVQQYVPVIL
ncbi:hypothetical protein ACS0TY_024841 [Phlomoides rotata]